MRSVSRRRIYDWLRRRRRRQRAKALTVGVQRLNQDDILDEGTFYASAQKKAD
jgi:DNA-directed RNA polymerase specialized sigma24 family protein